jgi:DNA-binding transcriptional LysR family regulator
MDLLETRELRYFITVAETLHFGRAAATLRIAQPALSKAVRRLEDRLGLRLLVRSSRSVTLTPAGQALLEHGRIALAAVAAAADSARRVADGEHLRLVIKPGGDANLLSGLLAAYARTPHARPVDILFGGGADRSGLLRDHRADAALLYVPFDDTAGLDLRVLHTEGRVAVLPAHHRLAGRSGIAHDDLAGEPHARWRGTTATGTGPEVGNLGELIPLVRLGRAVTILPRSLVSEPPAGVCLVPVTDAEPSHIVIARRIDDHRPGVAAFIDAAVRSVMNPRRDDASPAVPAGRGGSAPTPPRPDVDERAAQLMQNSLPSGSVITNHENGPWE